MAFLICRNGSERISPERATLSTRNVRDVHAYTCTFNRRTSLVTHRSHWRSSLVLLMSIHCSLAAEQLRNSHCHEFVEYYSTTAALSAYIEGTKTPIDPQGAPMEELIMLQDVSLIVISGYLRHPVAVSTSLAIFIIIGLQ